MVDTTRNKRRLEDESSDEDSESEESEYQPTKGGKPPPKKGHQSRIKKKETEKKVHNVSSKIDTFTPKQLQIHTSMGRSTLGYYCRTHLKTFQDRQNAIRHIREFHEPVLSNKRAYTNAMEYMDKLKDDKPHPIEYVSDDTLPGKKCSRCGLIIDKTEYATLKSHRSSLCWKTSDDNVTYVDVFYLRTTCCRNVEPKETIREGTIDLTSGILDVIPKKTIIPRPVSFSSMYNTVQDYFYHETAWNPEDITWFGNLSAWIPNIVSMNTYLENKSWAIGFVESDISIADVMNDEKDNNLGCTCIHALIQTGKLWLYSEWAHNAFQSLSERIKYKLGLSMEYHALYSGTETNVWPPFAALDNKTIKLKYMYPIIKQLVLFSMRHPSKYMNNFKKELVDTVKDAKANGRDLHEQLLDEMIFPKFLSCLLYQPNSMFMHGGILQTFCHTLFFKDTHYSRLKTNMEMDLMVDEPQLVLEQIVAVEMIVRMGLASIVYGILFRQYGGTAQDRLKKVNDLCCEGILSAYAEQVHPIISYLHKKCSKSTTFARHVIERDQFLGKLVSEDQLDARHNQHYIHHAALEHTLVKSNGTYEEEQFEILRQLSTQFTTNVKGKIIRFMTSTVYERLRSSHLFEILSKRCIRCYDSFCSGNPLLCKFGGDFCSICAHDRSVHVDSFACTTKLHETLNMGDERMVCIVCFDIHNRTNCFTHKVHGDNDDISYKCPVQKRLALAILFYYRSMKDTQASFQSFLEDMTQSEATYYKTINEVYKHCLFFNSSLLSLRNSWFIGKDILQPTN